MDLDGLNKLDKLKISAFTSEKREEEGSAIAEFEAIFDIESFSRKYEHVYQGATTAGINTSARSAKYSFSRPSYLHFQLFIDGTGLSLDSKDLLGGADPEAQEQINQFLEVCYQYDGRNPPATVFNHQMGEPFGELQTVVSGYQIYAI
jgi:hypothetical protein